MADNRKVRAKELVVLIERCIKARRPVYIHGSPGIGKSDLVASIAKKYNRPLIDIRLLLCTPEDMRGLPYYNPKTNTMKWSRPNELPGPDDVSLHNAIIFFDELSAAPPSTQNAALQLILNRRIGEYQLPDGVDMIAAGNKMSDRGSTFKMPSPLANRFVHFELESNFDDWQKWALQAKIHPDVVGFLSHHKQNLFTFDPKSPDHAFATPRSWYFVSDLIGEDDMPENIVTSLVAGTVGEGMALEFQAHRKIASKLPKAEDVLTGKVSTLSTKEISAMYSLTISLCYTLKDWLAIANDPDDVAYTMADWHKNVDFFFRYMMDNFGTEMIILAAKTSLRDYNLPIDHTKMQNFKEFHKKYGDYIIGDD